MNTRYLLRAILLILVLSLAACGAGGNEETASNGNDNANEGVTPDETTNENGGLEGLDNEEGTAGEEVKGTEDETLLELGGGYIWRREGGIAGFCDVVTVLAGTATIASCATEPPEVIGEVTLTIEQAQLVSTWIEDLASFDWEQGDPGVADAMIISIVFAGKGEGEVTDEHIAAMQALAVEVLGMAANPTE